MLAEALVNAAAKVAVMLARADARIARVSAGSAVEQRGVRIEHRGRDHDEHISPGPDAVLAPESRNDRVARAIPGQHGEHGVESKRLQDVPLEAPEVILRRRDERLFAQ